jgi:hypothetical protein
MAGRQQLFRTFCNFRYIGIWLCPCFISGACEFSLSRKIPTKTRCGETFNIKMIGRRLVSHSTNRNYFAIRIGRHYLTFCVFVIRCSNFHVSLVSIRKTVGDFVEVCMFVHDGYITIKGAALSNFIFSYLKPNNRTLFQGFCSSGYNPILFVPHQHWSTAPKV